MRRIASGLVSIVVVILASCSANNRQITDTGYEYVMQYDAPGQTTQPGEHAFMHIVLRTADSVMYDSRVQLQQPAVIDVPVTAGPRGNNAPLRDIAKLMSEGDSLWLYYPADSFLQFPAQFQGLDMVIYDLKLAEIKTQEELEAWQEEQRNKANRNIGAAQKREQEVATQLQLTREDYNSGKLDNQLIKFPSGLKILVHDSGDESKKVNAGDRISAHYYGILQATGEAFDNSFKKGSPYGFIVGRRAVILGWDEGFQQLNKGAKATLFIPSHMAYGEQGFQRSIPPNADLIFYVEVTNQ